MAYGERLAPEREMKWAGSGPSLRKAQMSKMRDSGRRVRCSAWPLCFAGQIVEMVMHFEGAPR